MSTVVKDLGAVSAYAYAVEKGYTGTEAEFAELMADYAEVGQRAEDAAESALNSKTAAQTAATTATNKASEATTAAQTATTKAAEAQADADAAALDASQALSAASTATSKATEATTAAATATSAKTDAVAANTAAQSAKTAAQTAQTGAETAAASVSASAAQIATNTEDIAQLKEDLTESEIYKKTVNDVVISNSSYKYASYNNSKFNIYPVNPGDEVKIKAGSVATYYTVLTTDEVIVGSFPDYATGYSKLETIAQSLTSTITIPQDGRYILIVFLSGGNVLTPNFVKLGSYDLLKNVPDNFSDLSAYASELNGDVEDLSERVSDLEQNSRDISADIEYTSGHYIKTDGSIGDLASYKISELIPLSGGEKISVYANGGTASVVSILSKWTQDGTEFLENLYTCTGNIYETIEHTASENEYLKICYLGSTNSPVVNIYDPSIDDVIAVVRNVNSKVEDFENNTLKLYADISMFDDIAVCGDSYTAGEIYSSGSLIGANEKTRWGTVLSRMTGADVTTYASGGADTNTWQSRSNCLTKLLNDSPHELYILCLGINDKTYVTLGSASDMEHAGTVADPFPNTFYGNYASIITQIRLHAPNAKIIISKVFIVTLVSGQYYQWSSEAIEEIANYFDIPFIETADDSFFSSVWFNTNMVSGHPVAVTYTGIAKAMKHLISKCILDNTSYFADYYPN